MPTKHLLLLILLGCYPLLGSARGTDVAEVYFISGSAPEQRPVNAPDITQFQKDRAWYRQALKGVSMPYPKSLSFLEDQGAWYTPFDRPNAPGRYDIRGLYQVRSGGN